MVQATAPRSSRRPTPPPAEAAPRRQRPPWTRFSAAHALMVGSGLLAFVLVAAALDDRGATVRVAVAAGDVAAGAAVSADDVRWAELPADSELAGQLVTPSGLRAGAVATQAIAAGQPLLRRDLAAGADADGLRWLSIPVAREHAAGGALRPGDRVDVIDVTDGVARYVVTGAEVARVGPDGAGRGLTAGTREFHVVVRVDADEALAVAEALADGKVDVVRSTAATPAQAAPRLVPYGGP
ncbi:MAG TPA: SAF domain-containing protein [Acidimicrobiales bacterium]|nr:SAF domain-containing protein [Acidimicrobiales bacterium]